MFSNTVKTEVENGPGHLVTRIYNNPTKNIMGRDNTTSFKKDLKRLIIIFFKRWQTFFYFRLHVFIVLEAMQRTNNQS